MSEAGAHAARETIERIYRAESRRVVASLIRLLGDFDRAEEALHDAFAAALHQWPESGIPVNPRAWLVSAGRFKAIDSARRASRRVDRLEPADRHEPGARVGRNSALRPLLQRRGERVVQRLLGAIEVAEEADERGEHAAGLGAVDPLDRLPRRMRALLAHCPVTPNRPADPGTP